MNITLESELQYDAQQKIEWNDRVYHPDYGYGTVFHIEDDMVDVMFDNISGTANGYSQYKYDFGSATRKGVIYPSLDPSIFELKYPNSDVEGRVTTY